MRRLGLLTLGQSPRPDGLMEDVSAVVGPAAQVLEYGALDPLSAAEIEALAPQEPGPVLVTLLRSGRSVVLDRTRFLPHLQARLVDLERAGVDGVLLLCTGDFPELRAERPLVLPHRLLYAIARGLLPADGALGVLMPLPEQIPAMEQEFARFGTHAIGRSASPYGGDAELISGARDLAESGAALVYLDCFGYRRGARAAVRAATGRPALLARTMAARIMVELIGE